MHFHIIPISWKDSSPTPSRCFGLQPVQGAVWTQHFEKPEGETRFGECSIVTYILIDFHLAHKPWWQQVWSGTKVQQKVFCDPWADWGFPCFSKMGQFRSSGQTSSYFQMAPLLRGAAEMPVQGSLCRFMLWDLTVHMLIWAALSCWAFSVAFMVYKSISLCQF